MKTLYGVKSFLMVLLLMIGGIFLMVEGGSRKFKEYTTNYDLNNMSADEFVAGTYVVGDIYYAIDYFEERTTTNKGITSVSGRIYLVPVAYDDNTEEKYVGVYVPKKCFSELDKISEDTFRWMYGEIDSMDDTPTLYVCGELKTYDSTDKDFLYEYMSGYLGVSSNSECDQYILPYYINYKEGGASVAIIIIGAVLFLFGFLITIAYFSSNSKSKKDDDIYVSYKDSYINNDYTAEGSGNKYVSNYSNDNNNNDSNEPDSGGIISKDASVSKFKLKE